MRECGFERGIGNEALCYCCWLGCVGFGKQCFLWRETHRAKRERGFLSNRKMSHKGETIFLLDFRMLMQNKINLGNHIWAFPFLLLSPSAFTSIQEYPAVNCLYLYGYLSKTFQPFTSSHPPISANCKLWPSISLLN